MAWSEEFSDELEFSRGETRVGHKGWIAWIDGPTRKVHVQQGQCVRVWGISVEVRTDDREHVLTVPHGRLQHSQVAALDMLAIDVRAEGDRDMQPIQAKLAAVARRMLQDLLAIEMAKSGRGGDEPGKLLAGGLQTLGYDPGDDRTIEHKPQR